MVDSDSMGPGLQLVEVRFSNFLLGKLSREFKLPRMSIFHKIQMAIFCYYVALQSDVGRRATTCIVHADVTLTRSKVKVKITGLLNFRKLAKPCMLAAMTVSDQPPLIEGLSGSTIGLLLLLLLILC